MNLWENECCEYCGAAVSEKHVTLLRKVKGRFAILEHVPAGVCVECGSRYYAAIVLKTIEETIHGRGQAGREFTVSVYTL